MISTMGRFADNGLYPIVSNVFGLEPMGYGSNGLSYLFRFSGGEIGPFLGEGSRDTDFLNYFLSLQNFPL